MTRLRRTLSSVARRSRPAIMAVNDRLGRVINVLFWEPITTFESVALLPALEGMLLRVPRPCSRLARDGEKELDTLRDVVLREDPTWSQSSCTPERLASCRRRSWTWSASTTSATSSGRPGRPPAVALPSIGIMATSIKEERRKEATLATAPLNDSLLPPSLPAEDVLCWVPKADVSSRSSGAAPPSVPEAGIGRGCWIALITELHLDFVGSYDEGHTSNRSLKQFSHSDTTMTRSFLTLSLMDSFFKRIDVLLWPTSWPRYSLLEVLMLSAIRLTYFVSVCISLVGASRRV